MKAEKIPEGDLLCNERFDAFRKELEAEGFTLKLLWSAKTGCYNADTGKPFRYGDVGLFAVCGKPEGKQPRVSTVIVKNYGQRDGFGIWLDPGGNDFGSDIKAIVG